MKIAEQCIPIQLSKESDGYVAEIILPAGAAHFDGPSSVFASGKTIDATIEELRQGIALCYDEDISISVIHHEPETEQFSVYLGEAGKEGRRT
jgi:hypothetical protein